MKKKIQILLIFLIVIIGFGIATAPSVFAEDDYSISIKPIDFSAPPNVLMRGINVPEQAQRAGHENVTVVKSCYTGETFSLTAIIVPSNAYVGEVVWTVNQDYEVAKIISQNGLTATITGVKAGTCEIVCTAADGQGAYTTCKLTVYQHAVDISLFPTELILEPGETQQFIPTILPEDTSDKTLYWMSSDPSIATVDQDGVVMAVKPSLDPVTISVKVMDGSEVTTSAVVNVRVLVKSLEWENFSNVIYKNGSQTETFSVKINPNNATIPTLKYSSSDLTVATVVADSKNNNQVIITPKKPGKFILTCEATDGSGITLSSEIEVVQLVEHISLNTTEKILFLEDGKTVTCQLVPTALPANASVLGNATDKFIWKSSDDSIASVDSTGLVTAKTPGTAIITVIANDVGAASATCKIHVRKSVTSMEIDLYTFEYIEGSANSSVNLLEQLKYINGIAFVYSGNEVALNAKFNDDASVKTLMWQIPGIAKDANNTNIIGIFAKLSNAYTNPTIMTALPINKDNEHGYLTITLIGKATDGSGVEAQRIIQIRQPATSIEFSKTDMTLYVPDSGVAPSSEKIIATILPENAYVNKNPDDPLFENGSIVWVSADPNVAVVDNYGRVTAVGPGETTIIGTAADGSGVTNLCTVTVIQPVKKINMYSYYGLTKVELNDYNAVDDEIGGKQVFAYTNQEIRLYTEIVPLNATNSALTWSSSDPEVVSVEDGFLKIGGKSTASIDAGGFVHGEPVVIRAATTDGSGVEFKINLYVLEAGYSVEMNEFVTINAGNTEKLLLKVFKTHTDGDKLITTPISINAKVQLAGHVLGSGENAITIMNLRDADGNPVGNGDILKNVHNPSFDIEGLNTGLATITFDVQLNEIETNTTGKALIGNSVSFEKTCTVKVVGQDNRHIAMEKDSLTILINDRQQITTVVTPASATNFYVKYTLDKANDDYGNPYQYARIDENTGVIEGIGVGQVKVVATLYDSETGEAIKYDNEVEKCEMIVYISDALTGVQLENSVVYVGETLNLLDKTTVLPEVLDDNLHRTGEKSSVVKFEVISGSECIKWNDTAGVLTGVTHGTVQVKAIANYHNTTYESAIATIEVRHRLTDISLTDVLHLKINQVVQLTPTKVPLLGDTAHAEITWTSSATGLVEVTGSDLDNGFTGIIKAKAETSANGVTVTVKIKIDDNHPEISASCKVIVIGVYADDFSSLTPGSKSYTLSKTSTKYYNWGAYRMKDMSTGEYLSAGCMENGAFSLTTPYLYNKGETTTYRHHGTPYYYPTMYPLRTFLALERVEEVMRETALSGGWFSENDSAAVKEAGFSKFMEEFNQALYLSAQNVRPDVNAYLDLPPNSSTTYGKSHILTKSGQSYYKASNFSHWGYNGYPVYIFTGLSTQWESEYGRMSASQMVQELKDYYTQTGLEGSGTSIHFAPYFTSALTSLNTVAGAGDIATRQANALSIILTYFPVDDMLESGEFGGTGSTRYQLYHTTRQMLMWSVSGIETPNSYANTLRNQKYVFDVPHYTGRDMKYVVYMIQSEANSGEDSPNYVEFPHGYSSFYYACSKIVAAGRFHEVDKMMTLVEGFVWKVDQAKHRTIPSFASREAAEADDDKNVLHLYWDASANAYTTRVTDENGVLNYFTFTWDIPNTTNDVQFVNNGDGTLTIKVPQEAKDYIVNNNDRITSAPSEYIPLDNKYACAAFVKWECETEVCQIPYTKTDGSVGYAYLLGQNAQSQNIDPGDVKSSLGDPIEAYIAFAFEEESTYESIVTSNVQLLDKSGKVVEYVVPGEQYQLKYTYEYVGDSRGLNLINTNDGGRKMNTSMYGFAAELRARTNNNSSLKYIANNAVSGKEYATTNATTTVYDPIYQLFIDKTKVNIEGKFTVYNTPYGGQAGIEPTEEWTSGTKWNDEVYINAIPTEKETVYFKSLAGETKVTENNMESTSLHEHNITVNQVDGKVEITWTFYTGWITLSSPYIKAEANIEIAGDTKHGVATNYNTSSSAPKYVYGLTMDGVKAVQGNNGSNNATINSATSYIANYDFTGMVGNIVKLYNAGEAVHSSSIPYALFDGTSFVSKSDTAVIPFHDLSLQDLQAVGRGFSACNFGDLAWFYQSGNLLGLAVNIGGTENTPNYFVYWMARSGYLSVGTWDETVSAMRGYNQVEYCNYDSYLPTTESEQDGEGIIGSSAAMPKVQEGITTSFKNSSLWNQVKVKNNLSKFTMTNHEYYGGLGYFIPVDENGNELSLWSAVCSENALNRTWFHTDKTWQTVYDLSIDNLVVNTGAGITSPTLVDTRSLVNLNVYYTVTLDNSAYKMIVNRYGQVGSAWRQFYKQPNFQENSGALKGNEVEYYYRKQDFYYVNNGVKTWCSANENPVANREYLYVNTDTLSEIYPHSISGGKLNYYKTKLDKQNNTGLESDVLTNFYYIKDNQKVWCTASTTMAEINANSGFRKVTTVLSDRYSASATTRGDFIPDDYQNISLGHSAEYSYPAGYAEEKPMTDTLHTDVFVDFAIYDNTHIDDKSKRLDPATFISLSSQKQLEILQNITDLQANSIVFMDNIQTGKNYIQHSVPHVFGSIESGLKVFGFTAHVNMTSDGTIGRITNGQPTVINKALVEWGEHVGASTKDEKDNGLINIYTNGKIYHLGVNKNLDLDEIYVKGSSKLGHAVNVLQKDRAWFTPVSIGSSNKAYYYSTEYAPAYNNNATATGMMQYPAYNPYTLSTTSPNGSLVYRNNAGLEGFDITLGNNQTLHIPNQDTVNYTVFNRTFNQNQLSNGILFTSDAGSKDLVADMHYRPIDVIPGSGNLNTMTQSGGKEAIPIKDNSTFKYQSLNFYKYSDSTYSLFKMGANENDVIDKAIVNRTPAKTEMVNDRQSETYKITSILFKSTYTVSRRLGTDGWVDITEGSNPDALVNAGKGFELKIQVTYTNSNMTDYLVKYSQHSAQSGVNKSSATGVTQTQCNVSPLTGQYGKKSMTDAYTAKYIADDGKEKWNDVFGANLYKDIYVVMNNNNKYVYSHSGVYGSTKIFDASTEYEYTDGSDTGKIVITYTMRLSPVNGYFGNTGMSEDNISGLATQNMKFYTDSAASGTIGSLTIWTNPLVVTPFDYPNSMKDRYLADLKQIQYFIVNPSDNVDNIVQ